jgi:multicomponent Na+:H+ antiporter subunit E
MRTLRSAALLLALLGFWLALSGKYEPLFLVMGAVSVIGVTLAARPLLEAALGSAEDTPRVDLLALIRYLVWLLSRIPPAGVDVALIVLLPSRRPRPGVVRFHTDLHSPAARTLLANSITIVPGTMTLEVRGGDFVVHALTPRSAADLASAEMQRRIAAVFRVPADTPPVMTWDEPRVGVQEDDDR